MKYLVPSVKGTWNVLVAQKWKKEIKINPMGEYYLAGIA
jgi:hypothetical protein